ncbi:hypothetical protein B0H14DRAFT_3461555 [Mycena olivaceomarginata]|nr:hypothetical protein B0H14DRAFT_3461555 [Mycena olivaceomarginata]
MQAHPAPTPASTISESPSHHLLELVHGTPILRSDDTQRRGHRSRSPRASTLELAHSTPISRLDDTRRDPAFGRHTAAHPDPALGRHTAALASVPQPARSHPGARARHPRSRVWTTRCDPAFGRHTAARVSVPQPARSHLTSESPSHHLLEFMHSTIPCLDDTHTATRRSRSPRSHLTCTIPAGNCSHYVWTSRSSWPRREDAGRPQDMGYGKGRYSDVFTW